MTSATPKLPGSVKNDLVPVGTAQHAYLKTGDHRAQRWLSSFIAMKLGRLGGT